MNRRLTALLIPAALVLAPLGVTRAAPPARAARPAVRAATPATRPAAPATKPATAAPATKPATAARPPAARPSTGGGGKSEPLPTQEELRAMFDAGDYNQLLQKLPRLLVLKGEASKPYDRHGLLRLKGETHLKLRQVTPAAAAFGDAAEAAGDPKEKAIDAATQLLIKRSPGLKFTPRALDKNNAPEPIDIVDPAGRKSAFLALLEQELAVVTPRVKAARDAKQLAPIIPVLSAVKGLRSVEVAANGTDEQTKRLVTDLAGHTHTLVSVAVKDMAKQVDEIYAHANEILQFDTITSSTDPTTRRPIARRETSIRKRGLERQTREQIKTVISTCEKIGPATADLAEAFGTEIKDFKALREEAEEVGRRAEKVLKDPYQIPKV